MNELTPERLADIKGYMTNVNLPFRVQTDLPLLVAEVERLSYERNAIATRHSLLMKSYDEAFNDATKLRAQILINNAQWEKQHEATCDDLSAAQKRIEELEKDTAELKRSATWLVNELRRKAPADIHMLASVCAVEDALSIPPP